ncbi:MAG TPA: N-acyl homoserine lactonase family protein [Bryobacteraceae bacterium]|jgi:glyoxylase-like metal-dependent hydrolase (beta-lactamase superfamily II)
MRRWILAAFLLTILAGQNRPPAVSSLRLYVFDCGRLKSANPQALLDHGVTTTDMSVAAYLIVHPRGTLLWDTGVIPDDLVKPGGTTEARATVSKTLRGQLAEIGYKPADITYLALSHNHYDHSANGNEFAGSTWLVSKAERDVMFPEKPPEKANTAAPRFAALKNSKTKIIDGDYDVFGDGAVRIIATPGHTPGHQSLFVKLAKTGPIVLSGDLYHYPVEFTDRDFNYTGGQVSATEKASRAKLDALMKEAGAKLWIQHDLLTFNQLKKSPEYYE